jgi:hypothetical protein
MYKSGGLAVVLIALTGAGYLATLRDGHEWGDDFGLYVQHARNVVEGRDYHDTGYVYNPAFASLSPRSYPPVFPVLLAPVYRCFGLDLWAMKAELVLFFVLFLGAVYLGFRRDLPRSALLAGLVLLGLNPYLWDYKDRLLSEIPFLLFTYLGLHFIGRAHEEDRPWLRRLPDALLAGACIYLAAGTRSVGVVLVPCLVLHGLLRERRLFSPATFAALAVFAGGTVVQHAFLRFDGSYLDQLVFDPRLFARNGVSLVKAMGLFVGNGYSNGLRVLLFATLSVFALAGFTARVRERLGPYELFALFYGMAIVVWPCSEWNQRFLLPLFPLFVIYTLRGVWLTARPLRVGLAVAVLMSYAGQYTQMDFGRLREGIGKPETVALFDFIRDETGAADVFVFPKPRALALFTGRKASALHKPASDGELWSYLEKIDARFVIVSPRFDENHGVLRPFVDRYPEQFEEVFANADFVVYRVLAAPVAALGSQPWMDDSRR